MMAPRTVDFNAMPLAVRQRFIACLTGAAGPRPLLSDPASFGCAIVAWAMLALFVAFVALLSGAIVMTSSRSFGVEIIILAIAIAAFVGSVLAIVRAFMQRSSVPWSRGRYLFPTHFVDARERTLRLVSTGALSDIRVVHRYYNGGYTGTWVTFHFQGAGAEEFRIGGRDLTDQILGQFRESQAYIRHCVQNQDLAGLRGMDPFCDLWLDPGASAAAPAVVEGPAAKPLPSFFRPLVLFGASSGAGLTLALILFGVRMIMVSLEPPPSLTPPPAFTPPAPEQPAAPPPPVTIPSVTATPKPLPRPTTTRPKTK